VPPDFARQVRDALSHLHDPAYLQTHPLSRGLEQQAADGATGDALRRRLEDALAALEIQTADASAAGSQMARSVRLLRLHYLDAMDPEAVQREIAVSRAQFYRDRARALDALTSRLIQQWSRQDPSRIAPASSVARALVGPRVLAAGVAVQPTAAASAAPWALLVLTSACWGLAWFSVWSFAQTTTWLVAWAMGGAVSGTATAGILRLTDPTLSGRQARLVALAWLGAWTAAWLAGWTAARVMGWAGHLEVLAGADPDSLAYAVGKGAAWAGGGLLTGSVIGRPDSPQAAGGAPSLALALGWAAAAGIGHTVFWSLEAALPAPGLRFAVSGAVEGAAGGGVMLWGLGLLPWRRG
jgi:hypothetical protein